MALPESLKTSLSLPLVVAPMFLISGPEMALACCKQGIVGSFPALNQRTSDGFEEWVIQMNEGLKDFRETHPGQTAAPYAVNLIVHRTNPRWEADLDLCVKHQVPIVITSLGAATKVTEAVHSYGGLCSTMSPTRNTPAKRPKQAWMALSRCLPVPAATLAPLIHSCWCTKFARCSMA